MNRLWIAKTIRQSVLVIPEKNWEGNRRFLPSFVIVLDLIVLGFLLYQSGLRDKEGVEETCDSKEYKKNTNEFSRHQLIN